VLCVSAGGGGGGDSLSAPLLGLHRRSSLGLRADRGEHVADSGTAAEVSLNRNPCEPYS
jgi:hypothetical protein